MNNSINEEKIVFSDEELERIGKSVQEIDEAIGEAVIDINKPEKQTGSVFNAIMSFYVIIKSNQVGIESQNMMRALNVQVQKLEKHSVPEELGFDVK